MKRDYYVCMDFSPFPKLMDIYVHESTEATDVTAQKAREMKCVTSTLLPLPFCVSKVSIFKKLLISVPTLRHKLRIVSEKPGAYQLD